MPSSRAPDLNAAVESPGHRHGAGRPRATTEQKLWEAIRKRPDDYKVLLSVIETNAATTRGSLLGFIIEQKVLFEKRVVSIARKDVERLRAGGLNLSFLKAAALCMQVRTDLRKLLQNIFHEAAHLLQNGAPPVKPRECVTVADLAKRSCCTPATFVLPTTGEIADSILRTSPDPRARQALSSVRNKSAFTAASLARTHPEAASLLRSTTGRSTFQRLDPLEDSAVAGVFREMVELVWDRADTLIGCGEFLPCSLATAEFCERHHLGLFEKLTGRLFSEDAARKLAKRFDEIGNRNRAHTHATLNEREFSYEFITSKRTLARIVSRQDEFRHLTDECLLNQADYLTNLQDRFGTRVNVWVLEEPYASESASEASKLMIESVFLVSRSGEGLQAVTRSPRGHLEFIFETKQVRVFQTWLTEQKSHCLSGGIDYVASAIRSAVASR